MTHGLFPLGLAISHWPKDFSEEVRASAKCLAEREEDQPETRADSSIAAP